MQSRKLLAISIALINSGLALPALAQDEAAENNKVNSNKSVVEEVIVTAFKRETSLMETPVAVSALDAASLDRQGVTNIKDLGDLVPSLSIQMDNGQSTPVVSMRGVRSTNTTELGDPAVGLHVDGVYAPRMQSWNATFLDVDRVEVLRGPQGTLFGRNSTVGSINVITNRASTEEFEASVSTELARWNNRELTSVVNIPVSDTFALRFAAKGQKRDSYLKGYYDPNQFDTRYLPDEVRNSPELGDGEREFYAQTSENWWIDWASSDWSGTPRREVVKADSSDFYGSVNEYAYRASLAWDPVDSLSVDVSYQKFVNDSAGGINLLNCDKMRGRQARDDDGNQTGELTDCSARFPTNDNYQVSVNVPGKLKLDIDNVRGTVDWSATSFMDITYVFGFEKIARESAIDSDGGINLYDQSMFFLDGTGSESNYHELQFKSTDADNYTWIVGLNYFHEQTKTAGYFNNSMDGKTFWDQPNRTTDAYAIFSQGTYDITDKLHLILGGRFSSETKEDNGGRTLDCNNDDGCTTVAYGARDIYNQLPADFYEDKSMYTSGLYTNDNKGDWSSTDYRIGFDYNLTDDTMIYTSYATGFKAGGIGDVVNVVDQYTGERIIHVTSYDPETVGTFELGGKSVLLDGSLNFSATYFYSDYENMQYASPGSLGQIHRLVNEEDENGQPVLDPDTNEPVLVWDVVPLIAFYTQNVPGSEIQGLELEFDWAPYENGRITGFATWTKAEVVEDWNTKWDYDAEAMFGIEYASSVDPENDLLAVNLKGNSLPVTPEYVFNINFEHTFDFGSAGTLKPWMGVHWQSSSYLTIWNVDKHTDDLDFAIHDGDIKYMDDKQDAYYTVNLSLRYESADEDWYAEAFVNNATDEVVQHWGGSSTGAPVGSLSMPRYYGVRLGYTF